MRKEIKADVLKQHDLDVNNLVDDLENSVGISMAKTTPKVFHLCQKRSGSDVAQSDLEKPEEFNGQFMDVFQ